MRFDEVCSPQTSVKYVTDGMLVRETMRDPLLQKYSVVMVCVRVCVFVCVCVRVWIAVACMYLLVCLPATVPRFCK